MVVGRMEFLIYYFREYLELKNFCFIMLNSKNQLKVTRKFIKNQEIWFILRSSKFKISW